jgi:hypothetical protein
LVAVKGKTALDLEGQALGFALAVERMAHDPFSRTLNFLDRFASRNHGGMVRCDLRTAPISGR